MDRFAGEERNGERQMISVVLCTYNGEKYIREQLESLVRQTRQPDEVLILDDGSADATVSVCREFIDRHGLDGWQVVRNERNIGWADNFLRGFEMVHGDLIFPCDQDDIWLEDKIDRMAAAMEGHPEIGLLVCGYIRQIEDEKGSRREERAFSGEITRLPFDSKVIYIDDPGCVYCFTRAFYEAIKGYCFPGYPHDAFLLRMGKLTQKAFFYDFPGIYWRRHLSNATGKPVRENEEMQRRIGYYIACLEKMGQWCDDHGGNEEKKELIAENIAFYRARQKAFANRKLVGKDSLFSCLKYLRFYQWPKSFIGDAVRLIH